MKIVFLNPFRKSKVLNACLILVLSVSCSVRIPRSSVSYIDPKIQMLHDDPLITDETDEYKITVEPRGNVGDYLLFDIGVTNKSIDTLYVNPEEWTLFYSGINSEYNVVLMDTLSSLSTDEVGQVYADMARRLQKAENDKKAATIAAGIILIVGLLVLVIYLSDDGEDEEEEEESYEGDIFFEITPTISFSGRGAPDDYYMESIDREIAYYKQMNFEAPKYAMPLKLGKDEEGHMDLYFKRTKPMDSLQLGGSIGGDKYQWHFLHRLIMPTAVTPR